ncbi:PD-(D/E)XK nuclease family protein [Agromyces bracchium]|uniref:PD-(D/E)XK nuclease family protein n=1 Tax=Agromyces bracchium TaxID=88376 RepID=UPI0018ACC26F|nr:PD-(D/E)XK nuclease family protein [Agromyces bracchium]
MSADGVRDPLSASFPFLSAEYASIRAPRRPVNVFRLSGFPRWETVSSRVLGYFLDPRERHRLGSMCVDALLRAIEAQHASCLGGDEPLDASTLLGSTGWTVDLEAGTADGKRIDILLTNDELSAAIIVENKLDADVYNPFASYARYAMSSYRTVLSIVLAPTHRSLAALDRGSEWVSATIVYDDVFDRIDRFVAAERGDERSLDLLEQFIENTSERAQRVDANTEAETLEAFWSATVGPDKHFGEFFEALVRVNGILSARAQTLFTLIRDVLQERGILADSWHVSGRDRSWGRADGRVAIVYLGFELTNGDCSELMIGQYPGRSWSGFAIKAYPSRRDPHAMYGAYNHEPLAASWRDPDADVVGAFVAICERLLAERPSSPGRLIG